MTDRTKQNNRPLVSVVMPSYNTPEEYLRRAIESVLNQTYENLELIVVDDASTAGDSDIVRSYADSRIVLLRNAENRHVAYTLNRGLEIAKGQYIARMDSDDVSLPRRIEAQVAFLERHPDIDIVCAQARMFGARGGVFGPHLTSAARMRTGLFFACPVVHPTVMFRADFLRQHGLRYTESPDYLAAEDYEMWTRCIGMGRMCEYPRVLLNYRVHSGQISAAAGSRQQAGTQRVRARQLSLLGITPTEREISVHMHFCNSSVGPDIPLEETEAWARRLLKANGQCSVIPKRRFKVPVVQRYMLTAVKSLLQRRVTIRRLMRLRLTWLALTPRYYPCYFEQFLFSIRYNRGIKTVNTSKEKPHCRRINVS